MTYPRQYPRNPQLSEWNPRWWESYLVRYGLGTVVGALCVYFLLTHLGENVMAKALMMPPVKPEHLAILTAACKDANANACVAQLQLYHDLYAFNLSQLLLLGIYGLAYCYFASAPGLVLHAVRRQLVTVNQGTRRFRSMGLLFILVASGLFFSILYWVKRDIAAMAWPVAIVAFFMCTFQLVIFINEYRESKESYFFYKSLHYARQRQYISPDSYRHLREHGNAFFIVVLEFIFLSVAVSIFELTNQQPYWLALLVIWIVPGALIYFLGHRLESQMVISIHNMTLPTRHSPLPIRSESKTRRT